MSDIKIVDCFPFYDEFLMLDIRLAEFGDLVDKFVIVESTETFTGIPKPLMLSECYKERYKEYADKIEIIVADVSDFEDPWDRSNFQKNHLQRDNLSHLGLSPRDTILVGDADEIPKRETVEIIKAHGGMTATFEMDFFYCKFNMKQDRKWYSAGSCMYGEFSNFNNFRFLAKPEFLIGNAGWHFSYIKTPEGIAEKLAAFEHQELNTKDFSDVENIKRRVENVRDLFDRPDHKISVVPIDDSFPRYITENTEALKEWIA